MKKPLRLIILKILLIVILVTGIITINILIYQDLKKIKNFTPPHYETNEVSKT